MYWGTKWLTFIDQKPVNYSQKIQIWYYGKMYCVQDEQLEIYNFWPSNVKKCEFSQDINKEKEIQ